MREFARGVAVAREDGNAIAILVLAGEPHRFLEILGADDLQDGSEDLLLIAFHLGGHAVEQRRADEEALLVTLQRESAPVDHDLGAFLLGGVDPAFDPRLVLGGDHRAVMRFGIVGDPDPQRVDRGDQLFAQPVGGVLAHGHDHGQRHAALARRAEGGAREIVDHHVEIGVGHDDAVVLGAAHRLDALARLGAALRHVMRNVRAADEAHAGDVGMIEDGVDHFLVAMDDLQQPLGRAGLEEQFGQPHRHGRIALGRLEDEGVARRDRHAEHPHRDHRGEVERGDPCADADRLAHRIDVDPRTGALRVFALHHLGDAAGVFDHLEPALDVALGIVDHLAVFGGEQLGELLHVLLDQLLVGEHHPRAALRIGRGPAGLDLFGCRYRAVEQRGVAQRDLGLDLAGRRVPDLVGASGAAGTGGARSEDVIDGAHEYLSFLPNGLGARGVRAQPGFICNRGSGARR